MKHLINDAIIFWLKDSCILCHVSLYPVSELSCVGKHRVVFRVASRLLRIVQCRWHNAPEEPFVVAFDHKASACNYKLFSKSSSASNHQSFTWIAWTRSCAPVSQPSTKSTIWSEWTERDIRSKAREFIDNRYFCPLRLRGWSGLELSLSPTRDDSLSADKIGVRCRSRP